MVDGTYTNLTENHCETGIHVHIVLTDTFLLTKLGTGGTMETKV